MTEPWLEVVDDRLSAEFDPALRLTKVRRGRVLGSLSSLARRPRESTGELDPDVLAMLRLIGLDTGEQDGWTREFAEVIDGGEAAGVDRSALPHVLQAYVRAVGRIAAVEAAVILGTLRAVDPDRRADAIGGLLDELLPVSLRGFDLLHRAILRDALLEGAEALDGDGSELDRIAVGMVDLVGSTGHLAAASVEDLEHLVDAMFAAGQAATSERSAHIVKYVGDGVFIAANDVGEVADAALELVTRLESELPLRARGGIGYGVVVQRAGDLFGLPVNVAQALTKAALPGTVLLAADAAALLPPHRRGRLRSRRLPHRALGEQRVATLHPATD